MPKFIKNTEKETYLSNVETLEFTDDISQAHDFSGEAEVLPPALKQSDEILNSLNAENPVYEFEETH